MLFLPQRERRKLITRLEKYGQINNLAVGVNASISIKDSGIMGNIKGVPLPMQYTLPNGRKVLSGGTSYIGKRKIQDIPKSTYAKYSNTFLKLKAAINTSVQRNSNPHLSSGVSQSFDNVLRSQLSRRQKGRIMGPKPPTQSTATSPTLPKLEAISTGSLYDLVKDDSEAINVVKPLDDAKLAVISPTDFEKVVIRQSEPVDGSPKLFNDYKSSVDSSINVGYSEESGLNVSLNMLDTLHVDISRIAPNKVDNAPVIPLMDSPLPEKINNEAHVTPPRIFTSSWWTNRTQSRAKTQLEDTPSPVRSAMSSYLFYNSTPTTNVNSNASFKNQRKASNIVPGNVSNEQVNVVSEETSTKIKTSQTSLASQLSLEQRSAPQPQTNSNQTTPKTSSLQRTPSADVSKTDKTELNSGNAESVQEASVNRQDELVIMKDGHIFHELIPVPEMKDVAVRTDQIAYIDGERSPDHNDDLTIEEELRQVYADRFGNESQSSDDISKSDLSVDLRSHSGKTATNSRRYAPSASASNAEINDKRGIYQQRQSSGMASKRETLGKFEIPICRMCREPLEVPDKKILMCELCHINIHSDCISSVEIHPCEVVYSDDKIRQSFLKVFTSLLKTYRNYIKHANQPDQNSKSPKRHSIHVITDTATSMDFSTELDTWFRRTEFLQEFDTETKLFMEQLIDTQAFQNFMLDRLERPESDFEVLFFDECVKAKLNRSRFRFTKETTPFLRDASYRVTTGLLSIPPSTDDLKEDVRKVNFLDWNTELEIAPRLIQPLLTESDQRIMQSHTNELVHRARLASNMRRKQDFSKWMREKMKFFRSEGGGHVVGIQFTEDQRRELLEERLEQVSSVIDRYEASHVSSQTTAQIKEALVVLHHQNEVLVKATDEEQLVDGSDQEELQMILMRLIQVITIYEDHLAKIENSEATQLVRTATESSKENLEIVTDTKMLQVTESHQHGLNKTGLTGTQSETTPSTTTTSQAWSLPEARPRPRKVSHPTIDRPRSLGVMVAEWAAEIFSDASSPNSLTTASELNSANTISPIIVQLQEQKAGAPHPLHIGLQRSKEQKPTPITEESADPISEVGVISATEHMLALSVKHLQPDLEANDSDPSSAKS